MFDLLEAAVHQRKALLTDETNAVRLIDGAGDGLPGVILETYADRWLLSTTTDRIPPQVRNGSGTGTFPVTGNASTSIKRNPHPSCAAPRSRNRS